VKRHRRQLTVKALGGFDVGTVVGPVLLWPALVTLAVGLIGFSSDYVRPIPRYRRDVYDR
jgi:hypothetical protein